ncbi:putative HIT finger domain protein [Aspergillus stella-maris]|uniref:putative HIT finger domain protein n=1 Tax=Aspergillus stella-maris TaxID=1810926 RepID=UPI003CCD0BFE
MYQVEVLPNTSTTTLTPGWTYAPIPSKGFDPSKAALPTTGRKRGIRDPSRTDVSSRQANAIARHLAELDRENHRDVAIPIPARKDGPRESATRGTRTKVTSNVRRILQSQKTFRNYLDDEEAALAQAGSGSGNAAAAGAQRVQGGKVAKTATSAARRSATPVTTPRASISKTAKDTKKPSGTTPTTTNAAAAAEPSTEQAQSEDQDQKPEQDPDHLIKSEYDNDPLLKSYIPSAPSERIMRLLLAEPPLSYNASRAGPPITGRSARKFCCICGYWGKIRCRNCHQRTCGIECYKTHEDSRCGAFF